MARIESFLSARLFMSPQLVDDRIYFISNLSGHLSLFAMDYGGSVPEPLLPPDLAMQNPHLLEGLSYFVFPKIGKILVMLDKDGDENYQPKFIPINGGYPEQVLDGYFEDYRVHLGRCDPKKQICYFSAESRREAMNESYQWNLVSNQLVKIDQSPWGAYIRSHNKDHSMLTIIDAYTGGDNVLFLWDKEGKKRKLLYGVPLESRKPDQVVKLNAIDAAYFVNQDRGLLITSAIFDETYAPGYLRIKQPSEVKQVKVIGGKHKGKGELNACIAVRKNTYLLEYNIDGCSWLYEGVFDQKKLEMELRRVITGKGEIANGVLESVSYDKAS
ncbi:MAG: hypothetical protein ACM3H7_07610, partial [Acidobacteriaceae bacterium]